MYDEFCQHIGMVDPLKFIKCVPTRQGHGRADNSTKRATLTAPVQTFKVDAGYKIPKKAACYSTPIDREEGKVNSSDDRHASTHGG